MANEHQDQATGPTGLPAPPAPPLGPNGPTGPATEPVSPTGPTGYAPQPWQEPQPYRRPASSFGSEGITYVPPPLPLADDAPSPDVIYSPRVELQTAPEIPGVDASGVVGTIQVNSNVTVSADVIRAPFSEIGIAERLGQKPDFYRQLLQLAATALRSEAENYPVQPGQENSAGIIKTELNEIGDKFEAAAAVLDGSATDRFAAAAKTIVEARNQIARFTETYPTFTERFLKLTGVVFGCYALHLIGMPDELSALLVGAVITGEKLSDIIKAWRGGK